MTAMSHPEFHANKDEVLHLGNGADTHWPSALEIMQRPGAVLTEKQVLDTPPDQLPIYFQLNLEKGRDISGSLADLRSNYQNKYSTNLNLATTFNGVTLVARVLKEPAPKADFDAEAATGSSTAKTLPAETDSCTANQTAKVENILLGLPASANEEDRELAYNARLMKLPVHYRKEDISAVEAARIYGIDEQLPNQDIMAQAGAIERAAQIALMGLPADTSEKAYTAALEQKRATEEAVLKAVAENNRGKSQAEITAALELQKSYFFLKSRGMYVSASADQETMQSQMNLFNLMRDAQRMGLPANTNVEEIARLRAARVNNLPDNADALTIQRTKETNEAMISRATARCES